MLRAATLLAAGLAIAGLVPVAFADDALGSGAGSGAGSAPAPAAVLKVPLEAGAPEVNAAASPTVVKLGGHFTLYVTATFAAGVEVNLREPLDLGPAFEVRRKLSEDRHASDGRTTREWQVDVTPWELGDIQVAPIAVTFTASGHAGQLETNAVPLKIIGVLGDLADEGSLVRGLAAPTGLTMPDWFWIWIASAGGAAAAVLITALWLYRRRRRRTRRLVGSAIARPRRIDMTSERALERLLAIERSGALDRDAERKAGYAEMVAVIRDYLAARYLLGEARSQGVGTALPAAGAIGTHDLTSAELLARLAATAPPAEVEIVTGWLADCDLVKYGGAPASPAEAGKVLDDARALIVSTTASHGAPRPGSVREAA